MPSERVQRQIDELLSQAEGAIAQEDWATVAARARAVLRLDPTNDDAQAYLEAASQPKESGSPGSARTAPSRTIAAPALPASFADGRYEVKRFLGEGGKKRVYLCHDARLDRDVAFSLIKTEGLDDEGVARVRQEAQAMGRLGGHANIVTIHDIGEEPAAVMAGGSAPGTGSTPRPEGRGIEGSYERSRGFPASASQLYFVSELMGGGDVEGLIEKAENHQLPLDRAVRIASEVCHALEHAHGLGIIHRDVKPGNSG